MNTPRNLLVASTITALCSLSSLAGAQDLSSSTGIEHGSIAGHAFQNGGIGQEQVAAMKRHEKPYDLRITFSEGRHNAYAADLKLLITDTANKRVFKLADAGPVTDVNLPAGHYRVAADFGGVERGAMVDVKPGTTAKLSLHWPKDET